MKTRSFVIALLLSFPLTTWAAGGGVALHSAPVDLNDKASLQTGAKLFANYCLGCHSAQYARFQRLGEDLGLTEEELQQNLMFTTDKIGDTMDIAMAPEAGKQWFGVTPPDLSVTARARGADWLYTYLLTFYLDDAKPWGVNNLVFKDVGMPHVLWERQGWQKPVYETVTSEDGQSHEVIHALELIDKEELSEAEYEEKVAAYEQDVRNLVNFMVYLAEPAQLKRHALGPWVLIFLFIFLAVAYLLKKEYWRDIH
ncbi:MAG: cytochrome c1 [Pseudomonadota bacterium]|nr:cytochrome c1 [Pseudomonadota bacterium]